MGRFLLPHRAKVAWFLLAMLVAAGTSLALPQGVRWFVDHAFASPQALRQATLVLVGLGVLMMLATAARYALVTWTGERIVADIRSAVFAHVIGLSPAFFETRRTGEIIARLTSDVATLESVVTSSVSIALRSLVTLVGCIILMFYTNIQLAGLSFIAVPRIVFSAMAMGRTVRRLSRQVQDRVADIGAQIEESLNAIRTVQPYDRQAAVRDRYQATVAEGFASGVRRILVRALTMVVVGVLVFAAIGAVVWSAARTCRPAASASTASPSAACGWPSCARCWPSCPRTPSFSRPTPGTTSASTGPMPRTRPCAPLPKPPTPPSSWTACRTASTPTWAKRASPCPAAKSSAFHRPHHAT